MKKNVGNTDRIIRIVLGLVAVVLGFLVLEGTLAIVTAIIGGILLVTALVQRCPLYLPFKIDTTGK